MPEFHAKMAPLGDSAVKQPKLQKWTCVLGQEAIRSEPHPWHFLKYIFYYVCVSQCVPRHARAEGSSVKSVLFLYSTRVPGFYLLSQLAGSPILSFF